MAKVTSHTLNSTDGTHAGGIPVRLKNLTTQAELFSTKMDSGGRLSEDLDLSSADPSDRYELTFHTASYWAAHGISHPHQDEIVLRFTMPNPDARYHMPIILSPNGYSCWASIPET